MGPSFFQGGKPTGLIPPRVRRFTLVVCLGSIFRSTNPSCASWHFYVERLVLVAMSRRTLIGLPLSVSLLGLVFAPFGASAGDCDIFPGGICPPFSEPRRSPDFGDGWWNIQSAFTQDLVVNAPFEYGRVFLEPDRNAEYQQFRFLPSAGGQFQIQVRSTDLCLEGSDHWKDGQAIVHTNECAEEGPQFWRIEPHPEGFGFRIRRSTGALRCLDAHNPSLTAPSKGTYLQEWSCHARENQAWKFIDATPVQGVR
ncbi:RICIN domain-containing protein [Streptomyces sp. NPDC002209]|uniref:RICIN domain-containing protein n=1 Tax=Streptomyces sp. NPDC002209 TaxID=3364638 RepID=UPI0036B3DCBA